MPENSNNIYTVFRRNIPIRIDLIAVFLFALIIRVVFLSLGINQIGCDGIMNLTPDGVLYMNMASDILTGASNYEHGFYTFGPGFAYYLAILFGIFGKSLFPFVIFQVIISSLSCLLIYYLGMLLTRSYPIAIIASILAAISYTSIMLSTIILSDTSYFFLFLLSLILFILGFERKHWCYFIGSGILIGIAILFRSLGQFWPIVMILIAFVLLKEGKSSGLLDSLTRKKLLIKIVITIAISMAILSIWVIRNLVIHDLPIIAGASANGTAKLVGVVIENEFDTPPGDIWKEWRQEYINKHGIKQMTLKDSYEFLYQTVFRTLSDYPWPTIKAYFSLLWENLNDINYTHRALYPEFKSKSIALENRIKALKLNYINFFLSIIGMVILLIKRQYRALFILSAIYFYYALLLGFGRWQGSRLFYPAQAAWTLLIGSVIYYASQYISTRINRLKVWPYIGTPIEKVVLFLLKVICLPNSVLKLRRKHYYLLLTAFVFSLLIIFGALLILPALDSPVHRIIEGPDNFTFADSIVLSQIQLEETNSATQAILFDFYAKKEITENYRIFLHLYPSDKSKMLNLDFEPYPPVIEWQSNIIITQRRELDIKAGTYSAIMGFFRDNKRLGESCCFNVTIK